MASPRTTMVLLDAHAIIHRAYHALPEFLSSKGEPTGALYGLSSMLIRIIGDLKPDYLAACFDLPQPTYRHEVYEEYKAGRPKADTALIHQLERSKDIFKAFNIPMYSHPGFEADDILGTIVEKLKDNKDLNIIIASGDMDTLQLVDHSRVRVYTLKKGINDTILYDEKAVEKRFGFSPKLLPDYKGLRGDPSDNIIGVRGIGEKTATTLIKTFGGVDEVYKKLKKDTPSFLSAGVSKRIVKILKEGEEEAIFSKMLATIRRDAPIEFSIGDKLWREGIDKEKTLSLFDELEFRTLKIRLENLLGKKNSLEENIVEEKETGGNPEDLKKALIALWLVDSHLTSPEEDDLLRFAKTKSLKQAQEVVLKEIKKRKLTKVFEEIETPLIPIVERMNKQGVKIDRSYLKALGDKHHKTLALLEKKIWKLSGEEFNVNSSQQLGVVLFEKLQLSLKRHKKTSTGALSTKESELEKMKDLHPIIPLVLEYRELQKLLSTYIDNLPRMVDTDGRLRATFLQAGTTTGRMASRDPNLQNIPIKTELGKDIRNAFVVEEGFSLASFDYSQIELRIAAILSEDQTLLEIFKNGGDVHAAVASRIFKVPEEKVEKEMRRQAKVINFGILYGMGVNALRANLGTSRAEAQQFYNSYFETFKTLAAYLEHIKAETRRKGYTETLFGRRRYFSAINVPVPYIQAAEERMAVNAPFQGTCADVIKIAMRRIDDYIEENKLREDVFLVLQVHDELVYEVRTNLLSNIVPTVRDIMKNVLSPKETHNIPLEVNITLGERWGEMKPFSKQ